MECVIGLEAVCGIGKFGLYGKSLQSQLENLKNAGTLNISGLKFSVPF